MRRPPRNSRSDFVDDVLAVPEIVLAVERAQVLDSWVAAFPHHHHALLPPWPRRESQVVGGRKPPLAAEVIEKERDILRVIVTIVGKDIEAGEPESAFGLREILGEDLRRLQQRVIIESRCPVIALQKPLRGSACECAGRRLCRSA